MHTARQDKFLPPLFVRLKNEAIDNLTKKDTIVDAIREIEAILNIRLPLNLKDVRATLRLYYDGGHVPPHLLGIPDLSDFCTGTKEKVDKIVEFLTYEIPIIDRRMKNVKVEIGNYVPSTQELLVRVAANMEIGASVEHINFSMFSSLIV